MRLGIVSLILTLLNLGADAPRSAAARQFADGKLGLMFHWGIYAQLGKGEAAMEQEALPISQYAKLAAQFNPTKFDADTWVKAARSAGARYVVFTAKSQDGFCLFDSKLTPFDMVDATPFGKDSLKAVAEACKKGGLRLVVYYSLLDWHHPDYFPRGESGKGAGRDETGIWSNYVAYYQGQIREICTGYGPLAGIWLDGMSDRPDAAWDLDVTYKMIRELQPEALIGNNHHRALSRGEDLQLFERETPGFDPAENSLRETVISLNNSWGYMALDQKYMTSDDLIRRLIGTVARDSNLLVNIGVKPDGSLPAAATERLTSLGQWLDAHEEAVRGTRPGKHAPQPWGVMLTRSETTYVHILDPGFPVLLPVSYANSDIRILGAKERLLVTPVPGGLNVEFAQPAKPVVDTILVIRPISDAKQPGELRP